MDNYKPTQQNEKTVDTYLLHFDKEPGQEILIECGFDQNGADERGKQRLMEYCSKLSDLKGFL